MEDWLHRLPGIQVQEWMGAFLKGRLCRENVGPCWAQYSDRNECKWRGRWMRGSAELQWSKTLVHEQSPSSALFINTPTTQMHILSFCTFMLCCSKAVCCYLFIFLQFFTVTITVSLQNHYKSAPCDFGAVQFFLLFIYYYSIYLCFHYHIFNFQFPFRILNCYLLLLWFKIFL